MEIRKYKNSIITGAFDENYEREITGNITDPEKSLRESMRRSKDKIYQYARANVWEQFATYTFNPKKVKRNDYDECYKSVKHHLINVKQYYAKDLKYIMVPEYHADKKNYHFHALLSNIGNIPLEKAINTKKGQYKTYKGKQIYNIKPYKQGFAEMVEIGSGESGKVSNYLTKYITKDLMLQTPNRQRYLHSKNLDLPEVQQLLVTDDQYGIIFDTYIRKTVSAKTVYLEKNGISNEIQYLQVKL